MNIYEGKLVSQNTKVGIVAARFNEFITSKLLSGAIDTLQRHDVKPEDIDVERAERARKRAEKRLQEHQAGIDEVRAEAALKRALSRLDVANYHGGN